MKKIKIPKVDPSKVAVLHEGREKTNVKPPYWQCKNCNHRAPYYNFEKGMWWWLTYRCPKCGSEEFEDAKKIKIAPAPQSHFQRIHDKEVLTFIYNRMTVFHLENPRYDYMIEFKKIIDKQ